MKRYNITFIGAGPSTIYSVLKLIEDNYKDNICIIEKGPDCEHRTKKDVLYSFGGAGCGSDYKLSFSPLVGGVIPGVTDQEYNEFDKWLVEKINYFKQFTSYPNKVDWQKTTNYDTKDSTLKWDIHKTLHLGTDVGQEINLQMQHYIQSQKNIDIKFNTEVIDITQVYDSNYIDCPYKIITNNNENIYTDKVVIATGRFGTLPALINKKFDLLLKPRPFSLGIRVEDEINDQYKDIIKSNYDFKFTKTYKYDNIICRVRTFCCNSGNAHTAAEVSKEGTISFNGHALKIPDPNNNTVNYGIVCEVSNLNIYNTRADQINLIKKINSSSTWKEDNFDNNNIKPKRNLLTDLDILYNSYPKEIVDALKDFVQSLSKLINLNNAKFLYPEIKMSDMSADLNYKTFETNHTGLYFIGDCACTGSGSIAKAAYKGYSLAKYLKPNKKIF